MPADAAVAVREEVVEFALRLSISVDNVEFRETFWRAGCGVNVMTTKISTEVKGLLNRDIGKVLVAECDHFALGDEKSELGLAGIGELAELDTSDLRPDAWGKLLDLAPFRKEILEGRISANTVLNVVEWLPGRVFLAVVPCWEICRVL